MPPTLSIEPPLLNTASPWATTESHLRALLLCPHTGAVTTRTSLLDGFSHQPAQHRYVFFASGDLTLCSKTASIPDEGPVNDGDELEQTAGTDKSGNGVSAVNSLNSLGYSPLALHEYLQMLSRLSSELPHVTKPVIISVTGSPEEVAECYRAIVSAAEDGIHFPLAMEINLSCPNIPSLPPPAYSSISIKKYLSLLPRNPVIPLGIKIPPYTYTGQFADLRVALVSASTKASVETNSDRQPQAVTSNLSFLTATNTLGSCLLLGDDGASILPAQDGTVGFGGMAGPSLHPLALGNVASITQMLRKEPSLAHIRIIGVGGVDGVAAYRRMRAAGATAVGIATALGRRGLGVFEEIGQNM